MAYQQQFQQRPGFERTGTSQRIGQQGQGGMSQSGQRGGGIGQQMAGGGQGGQQMGIELEDALSGEMRLTLHDFVQSALVCEWCADQCLDEGPHMAECVRLCRDVADLALQNVRFIARDSVYGPDIAETFVYAAEECAQECANHPHEHCQECASTLRRAAQSTRELLGSIGRQPQGQQPAQ